MTVVLLTPFEQGRSEYLSTSCTYLRFLSSSFLYLLSFSTCCLPHISNYVNVCLVSDTCLFPPNVSKVNGKTYTTFEREEASRFRELFFLLENYFDVSDTETRRGRIDLAELRELNPGIGSYLMLWKWDLRSIICFYSAQILLAISFRRNHSLR